MVSGNDVARGIWLSAMLGALASAQACITNGDASLGNDGKSAGSGGSGNTGEAGSTPSTSGGKSSTGGGGNTAGKSVVPSAGEGGATFGSAGETGEGGREGTGLCGLPIDAGPCEAVVPRFAYDSESGKCEPFTFGGCEGNANNFEQQADCQYSCEQLSCAENFQSDTVFKVLPLNRPERACVELAEPILVSCSILLDPSLTVPSGYGESFCVKRDNQLYRAETTLPKADRWEDCSPQEAEIVNQAPDCRDL